MTLCKTPGLKELKTTTGYPKGTLTKGKWIYQQIPAQIRSTQWPKPGSDDEKHQKPEGAWASAS